MTFTKKYIIIFLGNSRRVKKNKKIFAFISPNKCKFTTVEQTVKNIKKIKQNTYIGVYIYTFTRLGGFPFILLLRYFFLLFVYRAKDEGPRNNRNVRTAAAIVVGAGRLLNAAYARSPSLSPPHTLSLQHCIIIIIMYSRMCISARTEAAATTKPVGARPGRGHAGADDILLRWCTRATDWRPTKLYKKKKETKQTK